MLKNNAWTVYFKKDLFIAFIVDILLILSGSPKLGIGEVNLVLFPIIALIIYKSKRVNSKLLTFARFWQSLTLVGALIGLIIILFISKLSINIQAVSVLIVGIALQLSAYYFLSNWSLAIRNQLPINIYKDRIPVLMIIVFYWALYFMAGNNPFKIFG